MTGHSVTAAYPASTWRESDGYVLWHRPDKSGRVCEPPVVGHPLSSDWDEEDMAEYVLWSRIPHVNWLAEHRDRASDRRVLVWMPSVWTTTLTRCW